MPDRVDPCASLMRAGPRRFPFYSRRRRSGVVFSKRSRIENRPPHRSPQVWGGTQQRSGIPLVTARSWPSRQAPARASPALWGLRPLGRAISRHAPPSIVRERKIQCSPPLRFRSSSSIFRGSARSSGGAVPARVRQGIDRHSGAGYSGACLPRQFHRGPRAIRHIESETCDCNDFLLTRVLIMRPSRDTSLSTGISTSRCSSPSRSV
jgi:hypothetical protein